MKTKGICRICNKEFDRVNAKSKICSQECRAKSHDISKRKYRATEKGKITEKKYNKKIYHEVVKSWRKTEKGILYLKKYNQKKTTKEYELNFRRNYRKTEKGKQVYHNATKKYYYSEKGKKFRDKWDRFYASQRRANKKRATPKWNDLNKTLKIYSIARKIEKTTGINMHVDHIIPLKGVAYENSKIKMCGLNVWYNLMPLPYDINLKKKNKCLPVKPLKKFNYQNFSLETLPKPNNWMKFINQISNEMMEDLRYENYKQDQEYTDRVLKNYAMD